MLLHASGTDFLDYHIDFRTTYHELLSDQAIFFQMNSVEISDGDDLLFLIAILKENTQRNIQFRFYTQEEDFEQLLMDRKNIISTKLLEAGISPTQFSFTHEVGETNEFACFEPYLAWIVLK